RWFWSSSGFTIAASLRSPRRCFFSLTFLPLRSLRPFLYVLCVKSLFCELSTVSVSFSSSEPHLNVRPLLQVHRIDEPHLPVVQGQNHRTGAHAFAEKPHALQQIPVRHARACKHHLFPRRQIFRVINALRILHSHFPQPFRIF